MNSAKGLYLCVLAHPLHERPLYDDGNDDGFDQSIFSSVERSILLDLQHHKTCVVLPDMEELTLEILKKLNKRHPTHY